MIPIKVSTLSRHTTQNKQCTQLEYRANNKESNLSFIDKTFSPNNNGAALAKEGCALFSEKASCLVFAFVIF